MNEIQIGKKKIGHGHPAFIIAEMSGNHNQSFEKAAEIVRAAKECGADAIKLQTYTADTLTLNSDKPDFLIRSESPWKKHSTLHQLFNKAHMPWEWHAPLFSLAQEIGLEIFSSPFDSTAVDFLQNLQAVAFKIASPEITDVGLLEKVARTGKPVIVSTGVAELADIELAVQTLKENGCSQIILLKCTASYPAPPELMNLRTIPDMATRFNCLSGLSDHSLGVGIPIAAVALGASVIEKHFLLDKSEESVDSFFSLDRGEFALMLQEIRKAEAALGKVEYNLDEEVKKDFRGRRSLYVSSNIKKGDLFSLDNVKSVRPAFGLHPKHLKELLGKRAIRDLELGDRLRLEDIDWQ